MYKIERKPNKLILTFGGRFTEEEGNKFFQEYMSTKNSINCSNTDLVLECTELKCSNQHTLPILQKCLTAYIQDGYKSIVMVEMKDQIAKMQMKRIHENFMNKIKFVANKSQVL